MANSNLSILVVVLVWMTLLNTCTVVKATTPPKFPAIITFGDSTLDTGNNNYIGTVFRASTPPYGVNFPGQITTGRFSDGKLVPDFMASLLGIKEAIPPFLKPNISDDELRTGVCFAFAGSGYDDLTTKYSNVVPVPNQLELFKSYIEKLKGIVGQEMAKDIIGKALVIISAGTNDIVINFFDIPIRRSEFDGDGYQRFLQQRLEDFIKELYDLGCRKMVVFGLPPIGCLPIQMTVRFKIPTHRKCVEDQNSYSQSYNEKLVKLLPEIQATLPGSKIKYADVYNALFDMIHNPQQYGFVETSLGCCGSGLLETSFLCNPMTPACRKPSEFVFWDSIHGTQEVYRFVANSTVKKVVSEL